MDIGQWKPDPGYSRSLNQSISKNTQLPILTQLTAQVSWNIYIVLGHATHGGCSSAQPTEISYH